MLTLKYGLSPSYVLDEMQWYEVNGLMKYEYYAKKDEWEQARMIGYIIAQVNSKKKMKIDDITTFYWEDKKDETVTSKEEFERLKNKVKEYKEKCKITK